MTDADAPQRLQLRNGLDALGHEHGAAVLGEVGQRTDEGPSRGVHRDPANEREVEPDDVRGEGEHVLQARVAGAGVVHGQEDPVAAQLGHARHQRRVVGHLDVLGELHDDPAPRDTGERATEPGVEDRVR